MRLRAVERLFACLGLAFASACAMPSEPAGELVGAYHISGALIENSCGTAAVPAADPLRFDVEVRQENGTGLWLLAMPPAHVGRLEDGEFLFELEASFDVGMGADAAEPAEVVTEMDIEALADPERFDRIDGARRQPCRLLITERVSGTLLRVNQTGDAGMDEASAGDAGLDADSEADLIGENVIRIRAASGNACTQVLENNGGPFLELPCQVRYDIEGDLVED